MQVAELLEDSDVPILMDIIQSYLDQKKQVFLRAAPSLAEPLLTGIITAIKMGTPLKTSMTGKVIERITVHYKRRFDEPSQKIWIARSVFENKFTLKKEDGVFVLVRSTP